MTLDYKKIRASTIHKVNVSDAGIASLQMVLKFYGQNQSFQELYKHSGTSKNGTSIPGLFEVAARYDMEVEAGEADMDFLKETEEPLILKVKINNKGVFLVLWGFDSAQQRFIITNPTTGIIEEYAERELELIWKFRLLLLVHPKELTTKAPRVIPPYFQWLFQFVKEDFPLLKLVMILSAGRAILLVYAIFLFAQFTDLAVGEEALLFLLAKLLVCLLGLFFLEYVQKFFLLRQGNVFKTRLIDKLFATVFYSSKIEQDRYSATLFTTHLKDVFQLQKILSIQLPTIINYTILAAFGIGTLCFYHWGLGLLVAAWSAFALWVQYQKAAKEFGAVFEEQFKNTVELIVNITTKVGITKISKAVDRLFSEFKNTFRIYYEEEAKLEKNTIKQDFLFKVASSLVLVGLLFISFQVDINSVLNGNSAVGVLSLVLVVLISVLHIASNSKALAQGKLVYENMAGLIMPAPRTTKAKQLKAAPFHFDALVLSKFSFKPFGGDVLLEEVSLRVKKEEMISIRGAMGGGKSVLLNLIYRIKNIDEDSIFINGQGTENISIKQWHDCVAIVERFPKLLAGRTVLENILVGEAIEEVKEVVDFLDKYDLADFINTFPNGLTTYIGDGGLAISDSQKKMFALLRALWKKPQLLLLDEPTSGFEEERKKTIFKLLEKVRAQMGIIIVSNDDFWTAKSDRVYKLENKKLEHLELGAEV